MWQAEHVQALMQAQGSAVALLGMTTQGDQILDRTLSKVGGKGLFVKELEQAMQAGHAQLAVHSLKDVPMQLPQGFVLSCILKREDPRDALVSNHYASLTELPMGAVVGTSSLRRVALLRSMRPDLKLIPLRGNLDTRLRKLDEGQYDAIVLAAAGLIRLGLKDRIAHAFSTEEMLPAAGQGAIGIETLQSEEALHAQLQALMDLPSALAVTAERAVSRTMGASCSMPLAAFAQWEGDTLYLRAAWGNPQEAQLPHVDNPSPLLLAQARALRPTWSQADTLGEQVAQQLLAQGATLA